MLERLKTILAKKELDEDKKNIELEKGDILAMFIALGSVMFPVLILVFLFIAVIVWVLF